MKPPLSQNIEHSGLAITLNGEPRTVPGGSTVASLIRDLGLKTDRVAVEMNRTIVTRTAWEGTEIPAAAKIEVVHLVGGG
jgi:thiamine biosynthesis protein ThiS